MSCTHHECVCVCVHIHVHKSVYHACRHTCGCFTNTVANIEIIEQLWEVGSLIPPCESWELNSDHEFSR